MGTALAEKQDVKPILLTYNQLSQASQDEIRKRVHAYKLLIESTTQKQREAHIRLIEQSIETEYALIKTVLTICMRIGIDEFTAYFMQSTPGLKKDDVFLIEPANALANIRQNEKEIRQAYTQCLEQLREVRKKAAENAHEEVAEALRALKKTLAPIEENIDRTYHVINQPAYAHHGQEIAAEQVFSILEKTTFTQIAKEHGKAYSESVRVNGPGLFIAAVAGGLSAQFVGQERDLVTMTALIWLATAAAGYSTTFALMFSRNKDTRYRDETTKEVKWLLFFKDIVDYLLIDYVSDPISYTPTLAYTNAKLLETDVGPYMRGMTSGLVAGIAWILIATPLFPHTAKVTRKLNTGVVHFFKKLLTPHRHQLSYSSDMNFF